MTKRTENTRHESGRRDFLKNGVTVSTALFAAPTLTLEAEQSVSNVESATFPNKTRSRTLGFEKHSLEVSALGFGCMGMSYHRSIVPDRKAMIALLRKAPDHGINFFDTAEAYGP